LWKAAKWVPTMDTDDITDYHYNPLSWHTDKIINFIFLKISKYFFKAKRLAQVFRVMATQIIIYSQSSLLQNLRCFSCHDGWSHTPQEPKPKKTKGRPPPPSLQDAHFSTSHWLHGNSRLLKLAATICYFYGPLWAHLIFEICL
jgi:hypothetical protein